VPQTKYLNGMAPKWGGPSAHGVCRLQRPGCFHQPSADEPVVEMVLAACPKLVAVQTLGNNVMGDDKLAELPCPWHPYSIAAAAGLTTL
jgi:hypothetical protein